MHLVYSLLSTSWNRIRYTRVDEAWGLKHDCVHIYSAHVVLIGHVNCDFAFFSQKASCAVISASLFYLQMFNYLTFVLMSFSFQIYRNGSIDVQWLPEIARRATKCSIRSTTTQRNNFKPSGLHRTTTFAHKTVDDCVCEAGRQLRARSIQTRKSQRITAKIQCNRIEWQIDRHR